MAMDYIYLTRQGYEDLKHQLEELKGKKRREIAAALEKARQLGDLSENAEYDAAREAFSLNEKKISELEEKLSRARIIEDENIPSDEVLIGAKITLKDLETEEIIEYTLVSEEEADYSQGKISVTSPVGKALLGHKQAEVVEIEIPAGKLKYRIEKIAR